jgi:O-antigen/teichoic acid export membrane protein
MLAPREVSSIAQGLVCVLGKSRVLSGVVPALATMKLPPRAVLTRLGWTTGAFGTTQAVRLFANVVLARLLAPEIFGIMLIVNTLRTGIELLSDIGIGQNIVTSRHGEDGDFLNTAWTLQILRGFLLAGAFAIAAGPIGSLYGGELGTILPVAAGCLAITGLQSVGKFVAQRRQEIKRITALETAATVLGALVQIAIAWIWPTVWALVYAGLLGAFFSTVASYAMVPGLRLRFRLTAVHAREIITFGKWIFASSILYFVATNFDRLYLGTAIPLAVLGVYGVARSLADVFAALVVQSSNLVVFPAVAAAREANNDIRPKLSRSRLPLLALAALGIAGFAALSDSVIYMLYDDRYHDAALMLPALAIGVWFTVLTTVGESVLLGIGRPAYGTAANAVKLVWLIIALPLGIQHYGVAGAVLATALADAIRYVPVMWAQRREHVSFLRQDVAATVAMIAAVLLLRELSGLIGVTSGLEGWWSLLRGALA